MRHLLDRLDAIRNIIAKSGMSLKRIAFMLFMDMIT
mgnify:CR=1 FL=1